MVQDNHSECKNAILGLLDALSRIKKLSTETAAKAETLLAIHQLATDAVDRHTPILPRL